MVQSYLRGISFAVASSYQYRAIVVDSLGNRVVSDYATLTVEKAADSPDTGDHERPLMYAALMVFFAAVMILVLLRGRRA